MLSDLEMSIAETSGETWVGKRNGIATANLGLINLTTMVCKPEN